MVHDRRPDPEQRPLTLRASGQVRLGNLVMVDDESKTLWLQETGAALDGPRQGQRLQPLAADAWERAVRWGEWKARHPDTLLLTCKHCNGEDG